jgi:hypothetical protein
MTDQSHSRMGNAPIDCRDLRAPDRTGEPFGDYAGDLQIVLFQDDLSAFAWAP